MKYMFGKIKTLIKLFVISLVLLGNVHAQDKKPNIIFFIADDMTTNMFNFLPDGKGKNLTPNIDRLAKEGIIMMGQHVASTVCTPSRYNCLTGKYASRAVNPDFLKQSKKNNNQRVVEWNTHIMPGEENMAQLLKQGGYYTGAVGKNHVIEVTNYQKIPLSADTANSKVMKAQLLNYELTQKAYKACGFNYAEGIFYENPDFNGPWDLAVHNLDWTTEAALNFLDKKDEKPFFLYFATTIPHGPEAADRAWNADRTITPVGKLDMAPDCLPHQSTIPKRLKEAGVKVNDNKCNLLWMDDALGALFNKLEETDQLDNTIIIFFNDHGQFAKGTTYQGAVHNPSVIWKKGGFKAGSVSHTLVSNVDFLPTILEMAGLKNENNQIDGKSFAKVLEGNKAKSRESMYFEIGYSRGVRMGNYKYISVRYPQWVKEITIAERKKILKNYNLKLAKRGKEPNNTDPEAPFGHVQIIPGGGDAEFRATKRYPNYAQVDQLYDLDKDPHERVNLFNDPEYSAVVADMQEELKKHIENVPGGYGEFKK
ncbi:DUF4976 domain-containing protein [Labilibacter sediminis]|nr:DUF4976 domain-containing protein [Labilibacter sediminis]